MTDHVFFGFGFGPIQSALFVDEAFRSGRFSRIVIAEIDQKLVDAIRANNGSYSINVAQHNGIDVRRVDGIEIFNPQVDQDRKCLLDALTQATEIVTSLPSVNFYPTGGDNSVAGLIAKGLKTSKAPATIIYTAENNNHAAEILEEAVTKQLGRQPSDRVQFLNTVIGKMSQVVTDPAEITEKKLKPMAPSIERAFLVEAFNKILVTRCRIENVQPGIPVFIEKDDLLPFEEAKLYGHNAIHCLLAYLGAAKGYQKMSQLNDDAGLMSIARRAFIDESGKALIKKYADLHDELFTEPGYNAFAEDLLERMVNPYLGDTIARAGRDPIRKLGYNDRIFGTMQLALQFGIEPANIALGALAGLFVMAQQSELPDLPGELHISDSSELNNKKIEDLTAWLWKDQTGDNKASLTCLVQQARPALMNLIEI